MDLGVEQPAHDDLALARNRESAASFAADLDPERAAFLVDSQVPWGVGALAGTITNPAWKAKPSWYLVATEDRMIPPQAQRFMAARAGAVGSEVAASHALYVSQPEAVADLIAQAASAEPATAGVLQSASRMGGRWEGGSMDHVLT